VENKEKKAKVACLGDLVQMYVFLLFLNTEWNFLNRLVFYIKFILSDFNFFFLHIDILTYQSRFFISSSEAQIRQAISNK